MDDGNQITNVFWANASMLIDNEFFLWCDFSLIQHIGQIVIFNTKGIFLLYLYSRNKFLIIRQFKNIYNHIFITLKNYIRLIISVLKECKIVLL
jgi:hypothetical protein